MNALIQNLSLTYHMPIRGHPSLHKTRRKRTPSETPSLSANASISSLPEQSYTRVYNDISNPSEIMECRHPLETGLKRSDIENPNNERFNRNILRKICINDQDFENLCRTSSSKYKNFNLTPIQKAMTYCMIRDGGCTTDEALCAFIKRYWDLIASYNNSGIQGSTGHKYRGVPGKRILHINYAILRHNLPLFIQYDEHRMGTNTIDGIKVGNRNNRVTSKESISKINSYNNIKKDDKAKLNEITTRRSRGRTSLSRASSTGVSNSNNELNKSSNSKNNDSNNKNESKKNDANDRSGRKRSNSDSRKGNSKEDNRFRKSGNDNDEIQKNTRNQKNDNNISEGYILKDNDQLNIEKDLATDSSNSLFSPYISSRRSRTSRGRFTKETNFDPNINKPSLEPSNVESFQEFIIKTLKNDKNSNNESGMTFDDLCSACQNYENLPGAYYGLKLERRVKSVLTMKEHLREVTYNDSSKKWSVSTINNSNIKKDPSKRIQKVLGDKDHSESENDDNDITNLKKIFMPEKLRILKMKELSIEELWNIVKDVGLC